MNRLQATLESYESSGELSRAVLRVKDKKFYSLLIDIESLGQLDAGERMEILFKETEVMIATKESVVSASNAFISRIKYILKGQILSEVVFDFEGQDVSSLITTASLGRLSLEVDKEFLWFIKANEITLQRGRS